ncbi:patatin-like phospholipase family protein [Candidatus Kaiserbacteria bacterium]|nr:patatin-like phospholipase family protein [Candidatus Kaiserbacteria bacterium]
MKTINNTPHDPLAVLRRTFWAKERLDAGELPIDETGRAFRLLIIVMGAGWGGAFGAGIAHALQDAGLNQIPEAIVGISSGVMTGIGLATGNAHELVPFYAGLLSEERLIEKMNPPIPQKKQKVRKGKIKLKEHVIDEVNKLLGDDAIHQVHMGLYAVVTESPHGKGKLVDLKNRRNPFRWIDVAHASMAVPGIFPKVKLGDVECVDGAASLPVPLIEAIRIVRPTDILIIGSRPLPDEIHWTEHALFQWYTQVTLRFSDTSAAIRRGMERIDERTLRALRRMSKLAKAHINCLAIFPSSAEALFPIPVPFFHPLTPLLISEVGARARSLMKEVLVEVQKTPKRTVILED